MRKASIASGMHEGWVSELLNKGKDPTIQPFAQMCIECGLRLGYILTGEGRSAESELSSALFEQLDPQVQEGVVAMLRQMRKEPVAE